MEVREGYKQTEVGVIPEDWDVDRIGNLASITTGSKNTQDKVDDGDFPFFVRSAIVERINSYSFDGEAVLTAGDGVGTGKVFHYINGKFDFHQRVYKISDFSKKLNGYFFYLYFSSYFLKRIMSMTAKSSVDSVRMEMIADMQISFPTHIAEQYAIATAISDVDALISCLGKLISKKRYIKQGAMQELLTGKKRLSGFEGKWEVKELKEIADINPETLGSDTKSDYSFKYISLEDVDIGTLKGFTEHVFCTAPSRARRKIRKGDVLVSTVRPNLKSHLYISDDISDFICSTGFSVVRCKPSEAVPSFVYFNLFSDGIQRQIDSLLTGSNYPAINSNDVKALQIRIPQLSEQTAIASIFSDMDDEIVALAKKLEKYRMIKQGMMQELLTGKTRLV